MIKFNNGVMLLEHVSELPVGAIGAKRLYLDHETNSYDDKRGGDNPWGGDRSCGISVTWDEHPIAYYIPIRHETLHGNLELDPVLAWHRDAISKCDEWVNHNVKFDAHFSKADGADFKGRLFDTLTMAKLVDSDRGFGGGGYALDALSSDWLDESISEHDQQLQAYLKGIKSKNYARVPVDMMAVYSGQDILTARKLAHYCEQRKRDFADPNFERIWKLELDMTPVLFDMENDGIRVDPQELKVKYFQTATELHMLQEALHKRTGYPIDPANTNDCYELIVNKLGLPVLSWQDDEDLTKEHNPSFDKEALKKYLNYPEVASNPELKWVFDRMLFYRTRNTLMNLFIEPFQKYQVNGVMHPQYNQLVRTGRMSCKRPNGQQNSKESKSLIHPDTKNDAFLSCDASQIEFRLIVHYANDPGPIEAYNKNPDTDFHTWVAEMCGIQRKPAKNVNFCIGYGGGKKKVMKMLAGDMELMGSLGERVQAMIDSGRISAGQRREAFEALATDRAQEVYNKYHSTLPGLKKITHRAAMLATNTGYVFNAMGRRRHIQGRAAWRAFNSITQGLASDLIKASMIALAPRYCQWTRDLGIKIKANVHDEILFHGDKQLMLDPTIHKRLLDVLETPPIPLRVPIRFGMGYSADHWGEASGDEGAAFIKTLREAAAA